MEDLNLGELQQINTNSNCKMSKIKPSKSKQVFMESLSW